MQANSSNLHIFSIPKKEIKTSKLDFKFPFGMGFFHVEDYLYIGGGYEHHKYFSQFKKIKQNGEATELQKMLTPKRYFPMTLSKFSLFTLGGSNPSHLK